MWNVKDIGEEVEGEFPKGKRSLGFPEKAAQNWGGVALVSE